MSIQGLFEHHECFLLVEAPSLLNLVFLVFGASELRLA
jgi:hypothetical protein